MTIHDQLCAALTALGCEKVPNARTGRYTVFKAWPLLPKREGEKEKFLFVGQAGALRFGTCASASSAMTEKNKARIIANGQSIALGGL